MDYLLNPPHASWWTSVYNHSVWFPPSPRRYVREVFPHTALREQSSDKLPFACPHSYRQASWMFHCVASPSGQSPHHSALCVTPFKSQSFPPKMFCCIFIISIMIVSDSLPRQCRFVSLSALSPTVPAVGWSFPVRGRVSQVALISFGTCHL